MGKRLILALVAFLTLLTLATPSRAQVPAPKVTRYRSGSRHTGW